MRLALLAVILAGCSSAPRKSENVIMAPEQVWVEEGSYIYHRKGCELMKAPVTSVRVDIMREKISKAKPYRPCAVCRP